MNLESTVPMDRGRSRVGDPLECPRGFEVQRRISRGNTLPSKGARGAHGDGPTIYRISGTLLRSCSRVCGSSAARPTERPVVVGHRSEQHCRFNDTVSGGSDASVGSLPSDEHGRALGDGAHVPIGRAVESDNRGGGLAGLVSPHPCPLPGGEGVVEDGNEQRQREATA